MPAAANTPQMEILVVSGQASIRLTMERELRKLKMKVKSAGSGREAMKIAKTMVNSLIIIDTGLPDMPVIKLLEDVNKYWALMRDVVEFGKPKAIVIAKHNEKLDEFALKKLGVLAKLQKPVNLKTLLLFVNKIVAGKIKAEKSRTYRLGIMDPETRSREYFKNILKADDISIASIKNEFEIAAEMAGDPLDILIIEVVGLKTDVLEYLTKFRQDFPKTVVLPCSVYIDEELQEGLTKLGIDILLPKPIDPMLMRQTVRDIIVKNYEA